MPIYYVDVLPLIAVPYPLTYFSTDPLLPGTFVRVSVRNVSTFALVVKSYLAAIYKNFTFSPILECVYPEPIVDLSNLNVIQWLSNYYACSTATAIETALPTLLRQGKPFPVEYTLHTTHLMPTFSKNAKRQIAIYEWLQQHPAISQKIFTQTFPKYSHLLKILIEKGYIERRIFYPTYTLPDTQSSPSITLTSEQSTVVEQLTQALHQKTYQTHLLWGVTGSGKTEIYHQLILRAKQLSLQTLYLVPEIMLSEQALAKLQSRLNAFNIRVAVWHSQLSDREKHHIWHQSLQGHIDLILGTRSAIFVPMKQLGLVIIDEEHEPAYKQSENPRYHGRDLAIYRAHEANVLCLLGSATPSVETWANVKTGKYTLHKLLNRPKNLPSPNIHLADMRYEKPNFEGSFVLSNLLREKISERLEKHEQTLLFLNRRGYAPYLFCPKCKTQLECPHCKSHLVFHKNDLTLRCHLCDFKQPAYKQCPYCQTPLRISCGLGTQRIESCLQRLYKNARILRLDSDVINQHTDWYKAILQHDYDIIVGTQMLAKGLDFPNLTLAGIIQADGPIFSEDFRASERTFQLIMQVSGRTGRFEKPGEVIVQSFNPDNDCIISSLKQDTSGFLDREYNLRKQYQYPPFRHMVRHIFRCRSEKILPYTLKTWHRYLLENLGPFCEILGPSSPYQDRINGYYRMHLLYLTQSILSFISTLQHLRQKFKMPTNIIDLLDVDPIDFR